MLFFLFPKLPTQDSQSKSFWAGAPQVHSALHCGEDRHVNVHLQLPDFLIWRQQLLKVNGHTPLNWTWWKALRCWHCYVNGPVWSITFLWKLISKNSLCRDWVWFHYPNGHAAPSQLLRLVAKLSVLWQQSFSSGSKDRELKGSASSPYPKVQSTTTAEAQISANLLWKYTQRSRYVGGCVFICFWELTL